ncbi:MAG: Crp/Fnr family transcriptional regulator [Campylobacteraceae bacterium]|nr:Crp/Fnr family transcriptional regulator [Campylobacteraceae bacterium]
MKDIEIYPFYGKLSQDKQKLFDTFLRPIELKKDTIIHYQGDVCKDILLLTQGRVRLYTQDEDFSEEVTLYTLKEGEQCLANTASVLSSSKTIGTAVTQTDIKGYLISEQHIKEFMAISAVYQQYIFSLYSKKIVDLTLTIQRIKFKNLDQRIMEYLDNASKNIIHITHNELANQMNTSRTVVSKVLKKLENKGEISLHRGYIEVF